MLYILCQLMMLFSKGGQGDIDLHSDRKRLSDWSISTVSSISFSMDGLSFPQ